MAIYERSSGGYVAERVSPMPGSEEAEQMAALAEDPESGWRCAEPDPAPEPSGPPAKSATKAEWVAYAVSQGVEQSEAEGLKRDELVALFEEGGES
ncbi:hypothetical protein ACFYW6_07015 [Streptomyces sp. NPDC002659]|uniref:hypothetical protein n=1 Tax=Streptomyces sp. NPDC002659 TaxID=3364656 RepID=UPI0036932CD0